MYRTRVFTVVTFAGVLAFGTAALGQCSRGIQPGDLPTTTTTTTVPPTTTTTTPRIVGDPGEEMVSVTPTGLAASYPADTVTYSNGVTVYNPPEAAAMTPDGRYVAFLSSATNLVAGDTNGLSDLFVRDRVTGTTQRISVKSDGSEVTSADLAGTTAGSAVTGAPSISADGRYVVFPTVVRLVASDTDTGWDVYRFDRVTGSFDLVTVSATGGGSDAPGRWNGLTIDGDGRYVAFTSDSTTLVANDPDPNGTVTDAYGHTITLWAPGRAPDVFLRDMVLGTTTLISTGPNGGAAMGASPDITPDGRYIAFEGGYMVTGFPDHEIMVYDRTTGTSELDGLDASGHRALGSAPSISADGNVVVFANSDPAARLTPDAPINSDGQALHLYARNRSAGTTELVDTNAPDLTTDRAPAMGTASLSADGRYVAFGCSCQRVSSGPNPGQGHLGIYRADLSTGAVVEVDANLNGVVADRDSYAEYTFQAITGDGASILFGTTGNNLVTFDDNDHADIFVSTPT